ncbi:molybdenum cofactor guanylyltransferase [Nitrospinae bacterium AH_259_B05_G02_I21]|nr:molybdenum cofactor guanylyltransferase [Nitrospinae bacterium AH_259_B05_G02_I21]MDA2932357.1 molybdenum cofactor guanylyltransferase [Nitrospinae bacterium AH-259-F20]
MGLNKAFVEVGGIPIIERALKVLQGLFDEVFIVATRPEPYAHLGCPVHTDLLPGNDSLGGLHAALSYSLSEACFLCACDMPFLNPRLIRYLAELASGADAVVPKSPDSLQPLHSVYTKNCLPAIEASIAAGQLKLADLISRINVRMVKGTELAELDPEGRSFFNINRMDDLEEANLIARTLESRGDVPHARGRNS